MVERTVIIFFWLAFTTYAASFALYAYLFVNQKVILARLATASLLFGFLLNTAVIAGRWYSVGYLPIEGAFESYLLLPWFLALAFLVIGRSEAMRIFGVFVTPLIVLMMGIAWYRYESTARLSPILRSAWITMHVTVVNVAYAAFLLAVGSGIFYLLQERQLKKRSVNLLFRRLPSLQSLEDFMVKAVGIGQIFLTMTIATGIIKAVKDVPDWWADGLVISTSVTWMVYSMLLGSHFVLEWRGRRLAIFSLVGFAVILFLNFVARPYLTSFHRFA